MNKTKVILLIAVALFGLSALYYFLIRDRETQQPLAEPSADEYSQNYLRDPVTDTTEIKVDEFIQQHSNWPEETVVIVKEVTAYDKDVNASLKSVIDTKTNKLYFDNDDQRNLETNRSPYIIYQLDITTGKTRIVYTSNGNERLYVKGKQGQKLVLIQTDFMDSPGPCSNDWLRTYGKILSLDISGNKKLFDYQVPPEKLEQEQIRQKNCQAEFDIND